MNISIHKNFPIYGITQNVTITYYIKWYLTFKVLLKLIMVKLAKKQVDILISKNQVLQILYHVAIINIYCRIGLLSAYTLLSA